jgi:type IV pilus assembly protein PilE
MRRLKHGGFTLIELMITIAIIGILAAVGYPAYTAYIVRANRSAAQAFMFTVGNRQEQAMLNARSYFTVADGTAAQWTAASMNVPSEVSSHYTVTVVPAAGPPPTYTVTATPKGNQLAKDTKCGTLALTNTGVKGTSGPSQYLADCWK